MPDESTARVALATCAQVPDLDRDTKTLLFPLARIGIDVRAAVWSDSRVDWGQYDLTVVRSCWDYHENRDRRPGAHMRRPAVPGLEVVPDSNELLYARVDLVGARRPRLTGKS